MGQVCPRSGTPGKRSYQAYVFVCVLLKPKYRRTRSCSIFALTERGTETAGLQPGWLATERRLAYRCYLPVLAGFAAAFIVRPDLHRPAYLRPCSLRAELMMLVRPRIGGFRVTGDRRPPV